MSAHHGCQSVLKDSICAATLMGRHFRLKNTRVKSFIWDLDSFEKVSQAFTMSRLLFGSSNVYRHFSRVGHGIDLTLVNCTKKGVFDAHLVNLGKLKPGSLIVTSVLANFISDACLGLDEAEVDLFANQQITAHVESLADLIRDCTDGVAYVVPILDRKIPGSCLCLYEKETKIRCYESVSCF
jgi:hypothetical protein